MTETLKTARSNAKRAVTKQINLIRQQIATDEIKDISAEISKLKTLFANFERAASDYQVALQDDEDVDNCELYFEETHNRYIKVLEQAKSLSTNSGSLGKVSNDSGDSVSGDHHVDLAALLNAFKLPKVELEVFRGDPMRYHQFMKSFDLNVHDIDTDDNFKLTRLMQYTAGSAREAINGCMLIGGPAGYSQARDILKERFGNSHLVLEHVLRNLRHGKAIKGPHDLQQLSDDAKNAKIILTQQNMMNEVGSQSVLLDVVARLQPYLQKRWRQRALDVKKTKDKYPDFNDLCNFLSSAAKEATDPVYGHTYLKKDKIVTKQISHAATASPPVTEPDSSARNADSTRRGNNRGNAQYARQEAPCVLCKTRHRLWHCDAFKSMSPRERLNLVNLHKLCHNCLMSSHDTQACGKRSVCLGRGCGQKHTMYVHIDNETAATVSTNGNTNVANCGTFVNRSTFMPIVQVTVNGREAIYALLDTASSNTFCTSRLINQLGIKGKSETLNLSTMSNTSVKTTEMVQFDVASEDGDQIKMSGVYVVDQIPVKSAPISVSSYGHLKYLRFPPLEGTEVIDLLIGQDHSEALIPLEIRRGNQGDPFAIRSMLGWCLNGPAHVPRMNGGIVSNFISASVSDSSCCGVQEDVDRLWRIENESIDDVSLSRQDRMVKDLWDEKTTIVNGHYEIPIPWVDSSENFPNNVNLALTRLKSLTTRLNRENLVNRYNEEISKLVDTDYAELVPVSEIDASPGRTWYLPHHHVVSEKKPGKVRVVFDCASKYQGQSLNDRVLQGPDMVNKLINVLLRFRQHRYAVQADIEAMYNQVRIPMQDRDALRFVWTTEGKITHYRMTSHLFGGKWCASSSAYALRRTAQDDSVDIPHKVKETIENDFYVDDLLHSCPDKEEARLVIQDTPGVLRNGGFNLTKFVVNDAELLNEINPDVRAKEVSEWSPDLQGKVLGVKWDIIHDSFFFEVKDIRSKSVTKRKILSVVSSVYDPLGLLGPMILPGKLIFQDATRQKLSWDEEVPGDIRSAWEGWVTTLMDVGDLAFPRCVKPREFEDAVIELHHFADASTRAYGACSFIRCTNKYGQIHTQLIMSKNRVAPVKHVTIPRLELQAALLAAKLDSLLHTQLTMNIDRSYFWSDSKIVLGYIKNESSRFHVFVANRVSQIRELTDPSAWHYVSSDCNPADLLTRCKCVHGKNVNKKWFVGPTWLQAYKHEWPSENDTDIVLCSDDPELRSQAASHAISVCTPDEDMIFRVSKHFACWYKMQRAVAWLRRFIMWVGKRPCETGHLKTCEIRQARLLLLRNAQQRVFSSEIRCLHSGRSVLKSSPLNKLHPFLDGDGLMRVGGRIDEHPYIVPHQHPISRAIAWYYHCRAHVGTEWTLAVVRQEFWIVRARVLIKRLIHACVTCRKLYWKPCNQKMADLPPERLQAYEPAFTTVGIDLFGPVIVKNYRSEIKRYGCIFSCMTTRAIHIEKVNSLEADSFINAFRRFVARRGKPRKVFSDNGLNLVGGESEMRKAREELVPAFAKLYAVHQNIEWSFIPPMASHMGGAWERMVGLVKRVMKSVLLGECRLSDEVLETVLCEIEGIVNGRPLTKLSDDANDVTPLTPNHLLMLKGGSAVPPGRFDANDIYRRRWRHAQHLANTFWRKWVRMYLPELQRRCKWTDTKPNLSVGDLVLITDMNTPRNLWPLALVVDATPGRDGLVRSVRLRTRTTELVRPITKVILLESATDGSS